ncbi:hypothetical protein [Photorhabdus thracensis]|nr:hypothetical protein [Photorhabdus thracensis]
MAKSPLTQTQQGMNAERSDSDKNHCSGNITESNRTVPPDITSQ